MTDKANTAVRGVIAIVAAAAIAGGLYFVFGNTPGDGDEEHEASEYEDRGERVEGRADAWAGRDGSVPESLLSAAQALHKGHVVEAEPVGGGGFEIEAIDAKGVKWKMVFDAEGRLVRDKRD